MAVAIAGLLSYIAMFSYIFWPQRTAGNSFDSRQAASVAGHFETADHLQQDVARPAGRPIAGSNLVRRLVLAKSDAAKQRIRAQLSETDDERLFGIGLTSEGIAALRGTASLPAAEVTVASEISPPIAGLLDATDDMRRHENDAPRRERVSGMLSA